MRKELLDVKERVVNGAVQHYVELPSWIMEFLSKGIKSKKKRIIKKVMRRKFRSMLKNLDRKEV